MRENNPESLNKPNISFFCPAYNDQDNIGLVIASATKLLQEVASEYEILVIEDGSPDDTAKVVDSLAATTPHMRVIHHEQNRGYGGALKTGFAEAKHELVMYSDGDNQFDLMEFKKLLPYIPEFDVVTGRRKNRAEPRYRKIQSFCYNTMGKFVLGLPFGDMNCAMKIFKREVLQSMTINSSSVFICMEMLSKAKDNGYKIAEVPVTHYPRLHGEASGAKWIVVSQTGFDLFKRAFRLK